MWDTLTLMPPGLEDGHLELLFWRYIDTDVNDGTSFGGYSLMNNIVSNFSFMATILINLQS